MLFVRLPVGLIQSCAERVRNLEKNANRIDARTLVHRNSGTELFIYNGKLSKRLQPLVKETKNYLWYLRVNKTTETR